MDDFIEYVKKRKAAIKKELMELETAERIYLQSGATGGFPMLPFDNAVSRPTIKEAVLQVLEEATPDGLTALEILERLNKRWWRGQLERTSLSPQLSRLRGEEKVVSRHGRWRLPDVHARSGFSDEPF